MNTLRGEDWYDPDVTTFGDRVAGSREQAGMTQVELAKRLGVKMKTLKAWEDDLSEPRANKLSMMAGLLNVSLLWLITGEGDGPQAQGCEGMLSQDADDMLAEIRSLQTQLANSAERLGRLEKNLRAGLKEQADA